MEAVHELDLVMAVKHGLVDSSVLETDSKQLLDFATGRKLYEQFVNRPKVSGGPRRSTAKRYRPVLDKFLTFAGGQNQTLWNQVNRQVFDAYAAWLDDEGYAYATQYLELNTLSRS